MITLSIKHSIAVTDMEFIKELQRQQSAMIRTAYKAASNGLSEKDVRAHVTTRFSGQLDSWFIQSAVKKGMGDFKSDQELKKSHRIYGGKYFFKARAKGKITNEEWKARRLQPLYLIGESPRNGNRKFEFDNEMIIFKPYKGKNIEIALPLMKKNWKKLWEQAVLMADQKLIPITISITPEKINITFDDGKVWKELKSKPKAIATRYAGIDMNPNYVGISVFDGGKLVDSKMFSLRAMTGHHDISHNKLEFETIEVAHAIGRWLNHLQVSRLFIEELSFKQGDAGFGRNFNRLTKNQWKRNTFKAILRKYFKFIEVNPAYSSVIGNILNPNVPDPIAASMEIARRGYELVVKKSKKFYPELPCQKYLLNLWKNEMVPEVNTWKELSDFLKNSKVKYRVPLPEEGSFRIFQSNRSLVLFV